MKLVILAAVLGAFAASAAVTSASAQDLSMCTANGFSVSCCQQSFKQYALSAVRLVPPKRHECLI